MTITIAIIGIFIMHPRDNPQPPQHRIQLSPFKFPLGEPLLNKIWAYHNRNTISQAYAPLSRIPWIMYEFKRNKKFPLTPIGVLAHRLRTLDRSLVPPSTEAEIFRRTCLQSQLQTSPPTPQKSYPKFRNPRTTFENAPLCPHNYSIVLGVGGSPIFFWIGI